MLLILGGTMAQKDPFACLARYVEAFHKRAKLALMVETLHKTSLRYPPHPRIAVVAVAARHFHFEVVSEYTVGRRKGAGAGK
jgi:hypothetical protein